MGIVAQDASSIAGLLVNVVVDASVNDELNLIASSASAVTATEVFRHVVAHPFNINVSASSHVAAQVDTARPTGFNLRKNGTVVGEVVFPAGSNDGVLTLHPAAPGGSMVLVGGTPRAAHWVNGAGVLVAAGTVTDTDHDGDFSVGGAPTAPGDTAPALYAGGLVLLGTVTLL